MERVLKEGEGKGGGVEGERGKWRGKGGRGKKGVVRVVYVQRL